MICPKCNNNRWETKIKHLKWQCRICGYIRNLIDDGCNIAYQYQEPEKLVSVIIPTHKGKDLTDVIGAIKNSTYKNIEILVIDEGKERSIQRNIGINKAKGEYLLFLDSDMIIIPNLIGDCVEKIENCIGIYIPEQIITKGWFGKLRNWERQFYTATDVDVIRFIRKKDCPLFDETMSGPEDSDWERRISQRKISNYPYYHQDNIGLFEYLKKKSYYSKSMNRYREKWPNDKLLKIHYRCLWIFLENGKWKKFLSNPIMAVCVLFLIFLRGIIYIWNRL